MTKGFIQRYDGHDGRSKGFQEASVLDIKGRSSSLESERSRHNLINTPTKDKHSQPTPITTTQQHQQLLPSFEMVSAKQTVVSAAALIASTQLVPAPFLAAIPAAIGASLGGIGEAVGVAAGVAGAVEGGISAGQGKVKRSPIDFARVKRQDYGTQQAWNDCHDQLSGASITFSAPSPGSK